MLKVNGSLSNSRASEPSPEVAWQYTEAFFQRSPENAFGIVERPWFESRLRAHLNGARSDDKVWYALRNVIWAIGSRIVLYKKPDFQNASHPSWGFFENTLSVIADILFFRASVVGVQALILMVRASNARFRDTNVHFRHTTVKASARSLSNISCVPMQCDWHVRKACTGHLLALGVFRRGKLLIVIGCSGPFTALRSRSAHDLGDPP